MFPGADQLTKGNVSEGVWLLTGPPTSGKTSYVVQFLYEHLQEQKTCLYVITDQSPSHHLQLLSKHSKCNLESLLRIVDAYSWRLGEKDPAATWSANGLSLGEVSIVIDKARLDMQNYAFALDSITTLSLEAGPAATYKFLQVLTARLRKDHVPSILTLEEDVHPPNFVSMLKPLFDGIFEMKSTERNDEVEHQFRIASLNTEHYTSKWISAENMCVDNISRHWSEPQTRQNMNSTETAVICR
ncbi:MAG: RAD55 family ATPase [Candidatus Bathyarchaeia archaeon]|jgi:KaiC/GvpD/RAD55 family RecA-like ATPase